MNHAEYRLDHADTYNGTGAEQKSQSRKARGEVMNLRKCPGCRCTLRVDYHRDYCLVCEMRWDRKDLA